MLKVLLLLGTASLGGIIYIAAAAAIAAAVTALLAIAVS